MISFFSSQENLVKCEVKIKFKSTLLTKDIDEGSTFLSKKYPFSCLSTTLVVKRHKSLN